VNFGWKKFHFFVTSFLKEEFLLILVRSRLYWVGIDHKNILDIRSFLGLAGYYKRFIERFSKISKPMTELLEKGKTFEWTPRHDTNFQELKERLTTAPDLTMPDMEKPFSIYYDALVKV
jgi:hypothetical protein